MASGKVNLKISPLASDLYEIKMEQSNVQHGLPVSKFVDFSEDLEFAGISKRGKLLSVPKSKGPAQISGYPLKRQPPGKDWVELTGREKLLITTNKPEICLAFPGSYSWMSLQVFVARKHLPERYEPIADTFEEKDFPGETFVGADISEALHFYAFWPAFRICSNRYHYYVVMPKGTRLCAQDWERLNRHIFIGQPTAPIEDTVEKEETVCFWFQGNELGLVQKAFGIKGRPAAFHNGKLGFHGIQVVDEKKAAKALPMLLHFPGKTIDIGYGSLGGMHACIGDVLKNPRLLAAMPGISVDPKMRCVSLPSIKDSLPLIDYPLKRCEWNGIVQDEALCPEKLMSNFFIPLREASRKYKLDKIPKYTVKIGDGYHQKAAGQWVFRDDVEKTAPRDRQEENKTRKERKLSLEKIHGALPKGWEKLTNAQLQEFFDIQQRLASGQLMALLHCPVRPKNWQHCERLKNWLKEQHRVVTCPLTNDDYIENVRSIEDLAQIPGFLKLLEEIFEENEWLHAIIVCPAIQALALTESI